MRIPLVSPTLQCPIFSLVAGLTLEVGICRATLKGTPTQPENRKHVQRLCHVKLVFQTMLRIIVITLGIVVCRDSQEAIATVCLTDEELVDLSRTECDTLDTYRTYFLILVSTHLSKPFRLPCLTRVFSWQVYTQHSAIGKCGNKMERVLSLLHVHLCTCHVLLSRWTPSGRLQ